MTVEPKPFEPRIVALTGGVGGAKLAVGLAHCLGSDDLLIAVNIGDDFEHLGLTICPDLDTLTYTLAGLNDPQHGWGRRDETWSVLDTIEKLGGETWFRLGDRDLALHLERTRRLRQGESLAHFTLSIGRRLGVRHIIAPISNDPVRTFVETDAGLLPFQDYFVRSRCEPQVTGFRYEGASTAEPNTMLIDALSSPRLEAVIICPSNPFLSIDPILALPLVKRKLETCAAPVIAISPIIGGQAVKGPTAKMMTELKMKPSAKTVARYYEDFLDGYVLDHSDQHEADALQESGLTTAAAQILMKSDADKIALARAVLAFADGLDVSRNSTQAAPNSVDAGRRP